MSTKRRRNLTKIEKLGRIMDRISFWLRVILILISYVGVPLFLILSVCSGFDRDVLGFTFNAIMFFIFLFIPVVMKD